MSARLGKFIIDQLPSALASDGRSLKRALTDAQLADESHVTKATLTLIKDAYNPAVNGAGANAVHKALGLAQASDGADAAKAAAAAAKTEENRMRQMMAAMLKKAGVSESALAALGSSKGKGDKGPPKGKGSSVRLPDGKFCSEGTCNFNHDETHPGQRCYRAPGFEGPLPLRTYNNVPQRERIVPVHLRPRSTVASAPLHHRPLAHASRHHRPSPRALQERCRTVHPRSPSAAVSLRTLMPTGNRPTSRTSPLAAA